MIATLLKVQLIVHGLHQDLVSEEYKQAAWDSKVKTEAQGLLTQITSFEWIVSFMTVYISLSHLHPLTIRLQKSTIEILEGYKMVNVDYRYMYTVLADRSGFIC